MLEIEDSGIGIEEWRSKISQVLYDAEHIIVLLTPGSNERPWVLFESGIAYGHIKWCQSRSNKQKAASFHAEDTA